MEQIVCRLDILILSEFSLLLLALSDHTYQETDEGNHQGEIMEGNREPI